MRHFDPKEVNDFVERMLALRFRSIWYVYTALIVGLILAFVLGWFP